MANNRNIFSGLNDVLFGNSIPKDLKKTTTYNIGNSSPVIYSTNDRDEYEVKKTQLKQQKFLFAPF